MRALLVLGLAACGGTHEQPVTARAAPSASVSVVVAPSASVAPSAVPSATESAPSPPPPPLTTATERIPVRDIGTCGAVQPKPPKMLITPRFLTARLEQTPLGAATRARIVRSADEFRRAFGGEPPTEASFDKERLAVLLVTHASNVGEIVDSQTLRHGHLVLRIASTYGCTGVAPHMVTTALTVALPTTDEPVALERCNVATPPCGPVP